jgi:hypothetical protein
MFCFLDTYKEKRYTVLIAGGKRDSYGWMPVQKIKTKFDIIFRKKVYQ